MLWASVSSAAGLAPTFDADFPCDQDDALLKSSAAGKGNESKEQPRQEERGALNSKLCSRAHKGRCCEVHDAATLARDPRPRPPRLHPPVVNEHINAVQQAMKWFNFDEYRVRERERGREGEREREREREREYTYIYMYIYIINIFPGGETRSWHQSGSASGG
jgi:hypothetical protein